MKYLDPNTIAIIVAVIASTGFWNFVTTLIQHHWARQKTSPELRLLRGIGQIEIIFFGSKFLEQGSISTEEYDVLKNEIYAPYKEMGGNGLAEKMMTEVEKLPITNNK